VLFVLVSALIAAVWSVLSESVTYWVARLGGRVLVERMSRWLRVNVQQLDKTEAMFLRWGIGMVLFGRIFPGVRTLVSVPAGVMRMDFGLYLGVSFGGAMVWNTLLVGASYLLSTKLSLFGMSIFK
jgi:membrane protein DedA with SNARE-associated domain